MLKPVRTCPLRQFKAACVIVASLLAPTTSQAGLLINFDYSLDTGGFFTDSARRTTLELAASAFTSRIQDDLDAIVPGGINTWSAEFTHPTTGLSHSIDDLTVSLSTITVFVGARDLPGTALGQGGPGGWSASGSLSWGTTLGTRGEAGAPGSDFGPWGGVISFDNGAAWYFDQDVASAGDLGGGQVDFYSVAVHELAHVLGYGTANSWTGQISGSSFTGPNSVAAYGGNVPLANTGHWQVGLTSTLPGTATLQEVAMDPDLTVGTRKSFTDLDYAGLQDVGWQVSAVPEPSQVAVVTGIGLLAFARLRQSVRRNSDRS